MSSSRSVVPAIDRGILPGGIIPMASLTCLYRAVGKLFAATTVLSSLHVLLVHNLSPTDPAQICLARGLPLLQTAGALVLVATGLHFWVGEPRADGGGGGNTAPRPNAFFSGGSSVYNYVVLMASSCVASHLAHGYNEYHEQGWFDFLSAVFLIAMLFRPSGAPWYRQMLELTFTTASSSSSSSSSAGSGTDDSPPVAVQHGDMEGRPGILPLPASTSLASGGVDRNLTLTPQASLLLCALAGVIANAQGMPTSSFLGVLFGLLESYLRAFMLVRIARELVSSEIRGIELLDYIALPAAGLLVLFSFVIELVPGTFTPLWTLDGWTIRSLVLFFLGTVFIAAQLFITFLLLDESAPLVMAASMWPALISSAAGIATTMADGITRLHESSRSFFAVVLLSFGLALLIVDRSPMPLVDLSASRNSKPLVRYPFFFLVF